MHDSRDRFLDYNGSPADLFENEYVHFGISLVIVGCNKFLFTFLIWTLHPKMNLYASAFVGILSVRNKTKIDINLFTHLLFSAQHYYCTHWITMANIRCSIVPFNSFFIETVFDDFLHGGTSLDEYKIQVMWETIQRRSVITLHRQCSVRTDTEILISYSPMFIA